MRIITPASFDYKQFGFYNNMNMNKLVALILITSVFTPVLLSGESKIDSYWVGSYRYKYHKTMGHKNEIFFQGSYNLYPNFTMGAGVSTAFNSLPERFYLNLDLINFPSFLRYRLNLLSRDFPDYEIKENSINPTISLLTKYFELELGISFRFINVIENSYTIHTLYRIQWNILNFDKYEFSFKLSNFDSFRSENITSLYYNLGNIIYIGEKWRIEADIGFHDAGQLAFSSFFTSFYTQIGIRYYL